MFEWLKKILSKTRVEGELPKPNQEPEALPLVPARTKGEAAFYKSQSAPTKGKLQEGVQPVYNELPTKLKKKFGIGYPLDPGREYLEQHEHDLKNAIDREETKSRELGITKVQDDNSAIQSGETKG